MSTTKASAGDAKGGTPVCPRGTAPGGEATGAAATGRRNLGVPVVFFDTTLRDGEQSPGSSLNASEKLEIAHQLARLGVDVIEAGFPASSPGDFAAVQTIAREVKGPVICGLAPRATSAPAGRPSRTPSVHASTPSCPRRTSIWSTRCASAARR
jgi:hypothetical protein